ncbi:NAD(P)/FAD-dependent oxidoreductase OS=Streptomyces alboniger OX=132473 GN=CP975_29855 PE=4 SV=1 [Streptomyces alboniger]
MADAAPRRLGRARAVYVAHFAPLDGIVTGGVGMASRWPPTPGLARPRGGSQSIADALTGTQPSRRLRPHGLDEVRRLYEPPPARA